MNNLAKIPLSEKSIVTTMCGNVGFESRISMPLIKLSPTRSKPGGLKDFRVKYAETLKCKDITTIIQSRLPFDGCVLNITKRYTESKYPSRQVFK